MPAAAILASFEGLMTSEVLSGGRDDDNFG
jgi:hypothetical protein